MKTPILWQSDAQVRNKWGIKIKGNHGIPFDLKVVYSL